MTFLRWLFVLHLFYWVLLTWGKEQQFYIVSAQGFLSPCEQKAMCARWKETCHYCCASWKKSLDLHITLLSLAFSLLFLKSSSCSKLLFWDLRVQVIQLEWSLMDLLLRRVGKWGGVSSSFDADVNGISRQEMEETFSGTVFLSEFMWRKQTSR